jgi:hypothetical protein
MRSLFAPGRAPTRVASAQSDYLRLGVCADVPIQTGWQTGLADRLVRQSAAHIKKAPAEPGLS